MSDAVIADTITYLVQQDDRTQKKTSTGHIRRPDGSTLCGEHPMPGYHFVDATSCKFVCIECHNRSLKWLESQ